MLRTDWDTLLPVDAGIDLPLTWVWFDAWLRGFWNSIAEDDPQARLHILAMYDDRGIVAIVPLALHYRQYHGIKIRMMNAMANGSTPFWDLVLRSGLDKYTMDSVCSAVLAAAPNAVTYLTRLRDSSYFRSYLLQLKRRAWNEINLIRTPLIHCSGTLQAHLEGLSRKYRKGLRKKLKTFEETADTRVEHLSLRASHEALFEQMVTISRQSWKSTIGMDLGRRHEQRQFLGALIDHLGPTENATIWIAYQGDVGIAYELHVRTGQTTYAIQADYADSARALSPGSIVEQCALEAAFLDPAVEIYDSCAADYWYLQRLTDSYREVHDIMVFTGKLQARILQFAEFGVRPVVSWIRHSSSKSMRTGDAP